MLKFAESSTAIHLKEYLEKVVEMLEMSQNYFGVLAVSARTVNVASQSYYI